MSNVVEALQERRRRWLMGTSRAPTKPPAETRPAATEQGRPSQEQLEALKKRFAK